MSWLVAALTAAAAALGADDDVDRHAVRTAVAAAGFGALADRTAAAARPRLRVDIVPRPLPQRLGTTRIGGPPDLPAGTRWPRCRGQAMSFVAQLRLADLPPAGRALRRLGGRLVVFTHVDFERGSEGDPDSANDGGECVRVLHLRAGTPLRRRARPPAAMRIRPGALRFARRPDVPDADYDADRLGPPLRDAPFDGDRWLEWSEMRSALRGADTDPAHGLLGYASTPNGTANPCWRRTQRATRPWRSLLELGYDEAVRFTIGDAGTLALHLPAGDLRRGRFDRVCGYVDQ